MSTPAVAYGWAVARYWHNNTWMNKDGKPSEIPYVMGSQYEAEAHRERNRSFDDSEWYLVRVTVVEQR